MFYAEFPTEKKKERKEKSVKIGEGSDGEINEIHCAERGWKYGEAKRRAKRY